MTLSVNPDPAPGPGHDRRPGVSIRGNPRQSARREKFIGKAGLPLTYPYIVVN